MVEFDLVLMSLCIFLPSLFALVLLFFPKGSEEYMRWWTLLGTAITFVISAFLLVDYLGLLGASLDEHMAKTDMARPREEKVGLMARAEVATSKALKAEKRDDKDLLS